MIKVYKNSCCVLPAECVAAQLYLNPGEHDPEQLTGLGGGSLEEHAAKMAASKGGIRAPRRLLIPTQLVEAGELTLHLATNITLKTEAKFFKLLRSRK
jgi:hypothetical protein